MRLKETKIQKQKMLKKDSEMLVNFITLPFKILFYIIGAFYKAYR